ncbi:hypothetical protein DVH05_027697 [Phytophthora capsici]|nr:hypothetical protein DVH05_027697 [Phytophthora capsici]
MKTVVVTVLSIAIALVSSPIAATNQDTHRRLILGGTLVPAKAKPYMVGLRNSADGESFCGGSLVSPIHVLTASRCTSNNIRWASIGTRYLNGTEDGEQIKVVSVLNHPNYSVSIANSDDFALLELETASSFRPVKLAAADDSDFKSGAAATALGWGLTNEGGSMSKELRRVDLPLISDKKCKQVADIDDTMMCAGGLISKDVCGGDYGGPLVIESNRKDIQVGVVSWTKDNTCGSGPSYPVLSSVTCSELDRSDHQ